MKNLIENHIEELRKVTWPTRTQAIHSMILVVVIMSLTGIFLGVVDYFLSEAVLAFLK